MVKNNQNLYLLFQQIAMGVVEWDKNFKIKDWNPAAQAIFGYTKEEALGKMVMDFLVPESVKGSVQKVWDDIIGEKVGNRNINENITRDGRTIICEWFNTALTDEDGKVVSVASMVQDITEKPRQLK